MTQSFKQEGFLQEGSPALTSDLFWPTRSATTTVKALLVALQTK